VSARLAIAVVCLGFAPFAALGNEASPEPDCYRMEEYRAPTPANLKGARVFTTDEARGISQKGAAAFIDVLPQTPRPANLARFAGCPGMPQNARQRLVISTVTPRGPTAGRRPVCRSKEASRSPDPESKSTHGRAGVGAKPMKP